LASTDFLSDTPQKIGYDFICELPFADEVAVFSPQLVTTTILYKKQASYAIAVPVDNLPISPVPPFLTF